MRSQLRVYLHGHNESLTCKTTLAMIVFLGMSLQSIIIVVSYTCRIVLAYTREEFT